MEFQTLARDSGFLGVAENGQIAKTAQRARDKASGVVYRKVAVCRQPVKKIQLKTLRNFNCRR